MPRPSRSAAVSKSPGVKSPARKRSPTKKQLGDSKATPSKSPAKKGNRKGKSPSASASSKKGKAKSSKDKENVDNDEGETEEEYKVESIVGAYIDNNDIEMNFKWEGYSDEENTIETLNSGHEDLKAFEPWIGLVAHLRDQIVKQEKGKNKKVAPAKADADGEFGVEDVHGIMWDYDANEVQYWVKWVGYTPKYNTWEPATNCVNCTEILAPFTDLIDHLNAICFSEEKADELKAKAEAKAAKAAAKGVKVKKSPAKKKAAPKKKAGGSKRGRPSRK